jgi:glycosyltransferase involved in cell wall biosynthesis
VEWRKGADLIVEAARRGGMRLAVAGPGAPEGAVDLGVLDPPELAWAYAAADCVLFPTRYEACSYVVLEALAAGVPLVTTRVGWMPDLLRAVPGYEALCVEPDVESIATVLATLDERAAPEVLDAAREHVVAHNSLEAFGERWLGLVRRVLDG